ncbi:MAG: hypothetical protein ACI8UO_004591, partial [Verrucomicrobiales bacterium]
AGKEIEVVLTGTDLDDLTELRFTHEGIKGVPVMLPADDIWPEARHDGLKFNVTIAENVPAGTYEARTIGKFGFSTPRFFAISAKGGLEELNIASGNETPEKATELALEQPVNARTIASRSNHYKLNVKKGQRVLVHLWGERLDSRVDASLTVFDAQGNMVAESLNEIGLDPMGDFIAAADGEYLIKVSDYLFNGGGLYYYRLMASTAPWIDSVFPPAGKAGTKQKFTVYGRNLPGGQPAPDAFSASGTPLQKKEVEIQIPAKGEPAPIDGSRALQLVAEGFGWRDGNSNAARIGIARDNIVVEDAKLEEQTVAAPCEVAGRFDYGGDMDLYRFTAKKDEVLYIEVIADRMAAGADPNLIIQQIIKPAADAEDQAETNKFLAESDDTVLISLALPGGFETSSRDSGMKFTAPADGDYRVIVANNFSNTGALAAYRLGIRPQRPGFQLIAVADHNWQEANNALPGTPILHAGGSTFVRVLALRNDGFDAPIELSVEGLPTGVYAPPAQQIWEQNDEAHLVIAAATHAQDWSGEIKIIGKAMAGDQELTATAAPGTIVWTAVDKTKNRVRSRLTSTFPLTVSGEKSMLSVAPTEAKVWQADLKTILDIPVTVTKGEGELKGNVVVTPYGLPNFKKPAPLNIPVANAEGIVKISFNPDGNNKPMASEGRFVFKVDGVVGKYKVSPEHIERWTDWQKVVNAVSVASTAGKAKADAASNVATAAQVAADKAVTDNAAQLAALTTATAATQVKYDAALKAVTAAEAALKPVAEAQLAAAKKALADHTAAKAALDQAAAAAKTKSDAAAKALADADAALKAAEAAHVENLKKLTAPKTAADAALKKEQDALAAAEKAVADFEAARVPLATAAAVVEVKNRSVQHAAGLATTAIASAATNHEADVKFLTDAKTKADAALKAPETALAAAVKAVEAKKTANALVDKTVVDAKTKIDAAKKTAADATAALAAAEKAHADNLKKLTDAKTAADKAAADTAAALAAAGKAVADNKDEAKKPALAKAAADAKPKSDAAAKAAADTAAAVTAADTAHKANAAKLTAAKTTTTAAVVAAEAAMATALKNVATAKTQLEPLVKKQTEDQAKFDEAKKLADDSTAAIAAAGTANTANVAALTTAKAAADKTAAASKTAYDTAAKPVVDLDAKREALDKAVVDTKAKIEPAEKAVTTAETPIIAAETAHAVNLVKLNTAKNVAAIAAMAPELALASATTAVAEHAKPVAALTKAVTDSEAAVAATTKAAADKLAGLKKQAVDATAALATGKAAVTAAQTAKVALVKAAADAQPKADAAAKALAGADQADAAKVKALTAAKTAADAALAAAKKAVVDHDVKLAALVKAATDLQTKTTAVAKVATDEEAAQKAAAAATAANVTKLAGAKATSDAALKTAATALTVAKQAQAANAASKPILVAAAAGAKTKAEAAKTAATEIASLVTRSTAAKTLAAAELKKATDRAKEKDVKFAVFSEPIALRILEPRK